MEEHSIIYKDLSTNDVLGKETYQGISEITFPDIDFRNHPITITKKFSGNNCHRWIVKNIEHTDEDIVMLLSPRENSSDEEFLRKTYKNHTNILSNLTTGTFVEVDFGYIYSTKKLNGNFGSIKKYPDLVNDGEMHKRRLCIVVKACSDHVQVVPVSSQEQNMSNQSISLISHDSLKDLVEYNKRDRNSYSLAHMIEAVSLNRVLPPKSRNKDGVYRNNKYSKRLTKPDFRKFNISLAYGVSLIDYVSMKEQYSKSYEENKSLKNALVEKTDLVDNLSKENIDLYEKLKMHEAMKYLLEDTYKNLGLDISDITNHLKETQEILNID